MTAISTPAVPGLCAATAPSAIRMVAVDLDGTLLRSDRSIGGRTVRAIREAVDAGVPVVLASARPPRSVTQLGLSLPIDPWQVHYNGALIHDRASARHVFHMPLPGRLAKRIVALARRIDASVVVTAEILDKWYTDRDDDRFGTETSRHFAPDFVGPLGAFLHKPVTKLMLAGPPRSLGTVKAAVQHKFGDQVRLHVTDAHLIQIANREADKAAALTRVAQRLGLTSQHVLAVGDAPNDVTMLNWAGVGVAVGNAWTAAREAADHIGPTNDNDGVAWAIERFVLGRA